MAKWIQPQRLFLVFKEIKFRPEGVGIELLSTQSTGATFYKKMGAYIITTLKMGCRIKPRQPLLSFMEPANFINIISKLWAPHTAIVSVRTYPKRRYAQGLKRLYNGGISWLYPFADQIVVNAKAVKKSLIEDYFLDEKKIEVIYNGVDLEAIKIKAQAPLSREAESIYKAPTIICLSRLIPEKDIEPVLVAVSKLELKAHLLIVGEGPDGYGLQKKAQELGISDRVFFLDAQHNPFKYLVHASVLVLASIVEGCPNVVLEAMACGVPVIAADCFSGPREVLAPETMYKENLESVEYAQFGILVSAFSPIKEAQISDALHTLLTNDTLIQTYREKSKARILDFDIQKISEDWKELLRKNGVCTKP